MNRHTLRANQRHDLLIPCRAEGSTVEIRNCRIHQKYRGSALLLVLTAIALLSLVIMSVVQTTQSQMEDHLLLSKQAYSRRLAESGLAFALHPKISDDDPLLSQKISSVESFQVELLSEGSRLNINSILAQNDYKLLTRLFTDWELPLEEAQALVDTLADWTDPDSLRRLNGAERETYEAEGKAVKPSNFPFQSVNEMADVIGMEKLEKLKPDWREVFTVWSEGPLDLNEASADLIALVAEVRLSQAETLVQYRTMPDPNDPTKSKKRKIESMEQAGQLMGLTPDQISKSASRMTINSQTFRIKSVGVIDRFKHTIECVARRNATPIVYLMWKES